MTLFDRLNRETFNYNNGVSRNISATDGIGNRNGIKASDLLARFNDYTYRANNGSYSERRYY